MSQLNQDFNPQVIPGVIFNPGLSQLNQDFNPQVIPGVIFNPELSQLNQDFNSPGPCAGTTTRALKQRRRIFDSGNPDLAQLNPELSQLNPKMSP